MTRKVLVVDDSPLIRTLIERALLAYPGVPLEPVLAADGAEAFVRLHEHPDIALVLLDVNMPVMDGLEVLERLRQLPATRDIPVVLESAEDQLADTHRGMRAGARGYLTKPFTIPTLHRLLDAVLAGLAEES